MDENKLIDGYLGNTDWRTKENANEGYSISGLSGHVARTAMAKYVLNEVYPEEIKNAHLNGLFYIHDLGMGIAGYCVGLDFKQLLDDGLKGPYGKCASSPPKHFRTALGQLVNWIFLISQEVAGAVAVSSFDTLLAPYVKVDGLSYQDIRQGIQEFVYNLNQSTRIAFQAPFSNITLDLIPSGTLADEPVKIGGKYYQYWTKDGYVDYTYSQFQPQMDLINKAFTEVMTEGDAEGRVFTFPIPTYNITKDFNWDDKRYDSIWKMTGKYGIPYFANFVNSDMRPEDVRSMCCRLRLDTRELAKRGGLFSSNPTTGSIGVVTLNLPHIAMVAKENGSNIEDDIVHAMDLAANSLNIKRNVVEKNTENGLFPYMKQSLVPVKNRLGSYWANHFNSIGIIGMNEAVQISTGLSIDNESDIKDFTKYANKILDVILKHLVVLQEKYNTMFNLEATPAETATYVLAKTDLKHWPNMIHRGTKDAPYYSNSVLPPAGWTDDLWKYLNFVDNLLPRFTGGSVAHVYLGEEIGAESTKKLVKTIAETYKVPYFSITPTFSVCPKHGYIAGEHEFCPICDEELKKKIDSELSEKQEEPTKA